MCIRDRVGISRSSFYKYKDDIFPFYDNTKGKTITLVVQMDDKQGLLSDLLHVVAVYRANILTIHQSIPVNGVATLTLSVEVREDTENVSSMIDELEVLDGIHSVSYTHLDVYKRQHTYRCCFLQHGWYCL